MTGEFSFYVGVDWATEQHQARVMNSQGEVLEQRKIEHTGKGIIHFVDWMQGRNRYFATIGNTHELNLFRNAHNGRANWELLGQVKRLIKSVRFHGKARCQMQLNHHSGYVAIGIGKGPLNDPRHILELVR